MPYADVVKARKHLVWSAWLLCACCAAPAEDQLAAPAQVLAFHGADQLEAVHALVAIAAGEVATVAGLPRGLFHANQAVVDRTEPDLARRWSQCIPLALARCPAGARQAMIAVLERDCADELRAHPDQPWQALDFLPAPSAQARLGLLAAQAFDFGRFTQSLCASGLLGAAGGASPQLQARARIALQLCGDAPSTDPALALPAPGEPQSSPPLGSLAVGGLTVVWQSQPGWLLACTPDGRIIWQFRLDMNAEVLPGAGAALVHDATGLRAIYEDGSVQALSPPPGDTRLLAVSGGACWFATGGRAWRLAFHDTTPHALTLGDEPLGAPVVRGTRSLWLLPQELRLYDGATLIARMRHHLAVGPGWRLAGHDAPGATIPLLVAPDGGCWTVPSLAAQLAGADLLAHAQLLVAAFRPEDALAALTPAALASEAGRAVAFAAHCALGAAHLAAVADTAEALATDPAQLATVRYVVYRLAADAGARALALQRLLSCLRDHPAITMNWSVDELALEPALWHHVSSAQVLAEALERAQLPAAAPLTVRANPLQDGVAQQASARFDEVELDQSLGRVHRYGDGLLVLDHASGETVLTCHDPQNHALLWRTRWSSAAQAPSRSLALVDGFAVVAEGTDRLTVLDAESGRLALTIDCSGIPAQPSRCRLASADCLLMSGPFDDEVALATVPRRSGFDAPAQQVEALRVALPAKLRWAAPLPFLDRVLIQREDGQAVLYPGGDAVSVPQALAASTAQPQLTPSGLLAEGSLYRWNQ